MLCLCGPFLWRFLCVNTPASRVLIALNVYWERLVDDKPVHRRLRIKITGIVVNVERNL